MIAIQRPFHDVSQHVEQAKAVFGKTGYRRGVDIAIVTVGQNPIFGCNRFSFQAQTVGIIALLVGSEIARR
jgi:hypothetical protein